MPHINHHIILALVIFSMTVFSCQNALDKTLTTADSSPAESKDKTISNMGDLLTKESELFISNWQAYHNFDDAIQNYYVISNLEALTLAENLADLSSKLKESAPPALLKSDAIKSRLNILNSACLRLADMATISAITTEEVHHQIKEVVSAYDMLNSRINAAVKMKELESELTLDPDFAKVLERAAIIEDSVTTMNKSSKNIIQKRNASKLKGQKPKEKTLRSIPERLKAKQK